MDGPNVKRARRLAPSEARDKTTDLVNDRQQFSKVVSSGLLHISVPLAKALAPLLEGA